MEVLKRLVSKTGRRSFHFWSCEGQRCRRVRRQRLSEEDLGWVSLAAVLRCGSRTGIHTCRLRPDTAVTRWLGLAAFDVSLLAPEASSACPGTRADTDAFARSRDFHPV